MPSLTPGSWVVAGSNAVLHASLSSAFFSLRQDVISSALGINAPQSLSTSGVHAMRCSSVPCEKQGAGESVAESRASKMPHDAEQVSRSIIHFFSLFTLIRGPAIRNPESKIDIFMADTNTLLPKPVLVARRRSLELSTPLRSSCFPFGRISHRSDAHRHTLCRVVPSIQFRIGHCLWRSELQPLTLEGERRKPSYRSVTPFGCQTVYLRSIEPLIAIVLSCMR